MQYVTHTPPPPKKKQGRQSTGSVTIATVRPKKSNGGAASDVAAAGWCLSKAHNHYLHPRPFVSRAITVYSQSAESGVPFLSQKVIESGLWKKRSVTLPPPVTSSDHFLLLPPPPCHWSGLLFFLFFSTTPSASPPWNQVSGLVKWITPSVFAITHRGDSPPVMTGETPPHHRNLRSWRKIQIKGS